MLFWSKPRGKTYARARCDWFWFCSSFLDKKWRENLEPITGRGCYFWQSFQQSITHNEWRSDKRTNFKAFPLKYTHSDLMVKTPNLVSLLCSAYRMAKQATLLPLLTLSHVPELKKQCSQERLLGENALGTRASETNPPSVLWLEKCHSALKLCCRHTSESTYTSFHQDETSSD